MSHHRVKLADILSRTVSDLSSVISNIKYEPTKFLDVVKQLNQNKYIQIIKEVRINIIKQIPKLLYTTPLSPEKLIKRMYHFLDFLFRGIW